LPEPAREKWKAGEPVPVPAHQPASTLNQSAVDRSLFGALLAHIALVAVRLVGLGPCALLPGAAALALILLARLILLATVLTALMATLLMLASLISLVRALTRTLVILLHVFRLWGIRRHLDAPGMMDMAGNDAHRGVTVGPLPVARCRQSSALRGTLRILRM
jgi:hypothetical protein